MMKQNNSKKSVGVNEIPKDFSKRIPSFKSQNNNIS